jgi:signal transduction histidine kinase
LIAGMVSVQVIDDGQGFDEATPTSGFGRISMQERAALLNGTVTVTSSPGHGTTVDARIPV